tara:strand:- start:43 stop:612 length:570 start_codon:yes stop_codon:yes gene_type:complete
MLKFPLHHDLIQGGVGIDQSYIKYFANKQRIDQILQFLKGLPVDDVKEQHTVTELSDYTASKDTHFHSHELYSKIAVEIVNETNLTKGLYINEKVVRPIAYYTPFVVMASKNYLKHLRILGFKTFDSVWDESYDEYVGKDRLEMIYQTINSISEISLETLHKKTYDICLYNKSYLHSCQWGDKVDYITI